MIYVGIDVAKDKHDCFITNSEGEVLYDVFTVQNNMDGFEDMAVIISNDRYERLLKAGIDLNEY